MARPIVLNLLLQTGDAHHEKLVDDAREDSEKAKSLNRELSLMEFFRQVLDERVKNVTRCLSDFAFSLSSRASSTSFHGARLRFEGGD